MRGVSVEEFLSAAQSGQLAVFDVRSPAEFARGAIPGAHALPLFSDEERHQVGLTYHNAGRHEAIKRGLEIVGPKMRWYVEQVEQILQPGQQVGLYCWRGGMRSAALAWLLGFYGFEVITLRGGYKAFRRFVLEVVEQPRPYIILSGMTGAGKTSLLRTIASKGEAVVDLEQLASHRGSVFGALGMPPQPTQQQFENMLAVELWKHRTAERVWIEDESRQIGNLCIPQGMWLQMRAAPIIALDVPVEQRLEHLCAEYGKYPPAQLAACLDKIRGRLGTERWSRARAALEQGDIREVARIALEHYDKAYRHSLRKRTHLVQWISVSSADDPASAVLAVASVAEQRCYAE